MKAKSIKGNHLQIDSLINYNYELRSRVLERTIFYYR